MRQNSAIVLGSELENHTHCQLCAQEDWERPWRFAAHGPQYWPVVPLVSEEPKNQRGKAWRISNVVGPGRPLSSILRRPERRQRSPR